MRRAWAAAFLAGLAALLPGPAAAAATPARVGLFVETGAPGNEAVAAGLRATLLGASPRGRPVEIVERAASADESEMREALTALSREGVEVVAVVGESAARVAPETVRYLSVVVVSSDGAVPAGDRVRGVATTASPARIAEEVLRIDAASRGAGSASRARRIAVVGPLAATADLLVDALQPRGGAGGPSVDRVTWSESGGFLTPGIRGADLVLAAPETTAPELTDLARALSGQRAALVGSRAEHLDAGAAIVLRTDLSDVGRLAAAACVDALAGDTTAPRVRRPRRLLCEIHIANARRLGYEVPFDVLAASDRTVSPVRERK